MFLFLFFGFLHCTLGHSVAELVRGRTGEVRYFMRAGPLETGQNHRLLFC
jgi:hypothetical protein